LDIRPNNPSVMNHTHHFPPSLNSTQLPLFIYTCMCECRVHTQPLYVLVTFIPLHVYCFPFLESFRKKFFIFYDSHMCILWHIHTHHHKHHHLCVLVQLFFIILVFMRKNFWMKNFLPPFCILNEELLTFFLLLLSFF